MDKTLSLCAPTHFSPVVVTPKVRSTCAWSTDLREAPFWAIYTGMYKLSFF